MEAYWESPIRDGRVSVMLLGELDAATLPEFEQRLYELSETAHVSIDLTVATFLDLATARMLISCRERAKRNGRFLQIVNASQHVERMLRMLERPGEGSAYEVPGPTSTDAERSRPESEQIVRLECPACGHQTFRPENAADADCANCGAALTVVAIFRDRRVIRAPVFVERRSKGS
jgi:anti-anti-sigma factor